MLKPVGWTNRKVNRGLNAIYTHLSIHPTGLMGAQRSSVDNFTRVQTRGFQTSGPGGLAPHKSPLLSTADLDNHWSWTDHTGFGVSSVHWPWSWEGTWHLGAPAAPLQVPVTPPPPRAAGSHLDSGRGAPTNRAWLELAPRPLPNTPSV